MDPLTHALSGAVLARAVAHPAANRTGPSIRLQVAAGATAAMFPDLDVILRLAGTLNYLNWHQGVTHSLIMLPLWAVLLAHLFAATLSRLSQRQYRWRDFLIPSLLGLAIHLLGDLITAYGLMLFAPLSDHRLMIPLAFVIDPWITLVLAAGLFLSLTRPRGRIIAATALAITMAYIGLLAQSSVQALAIAAEHASRHDLDRAQAHVLPQPLSPFNWKLIIVDGDQYRVARVRLHGRPNRILLPKMSAAYTAPDALDWKLLSRYGERPEDQPFTREAWSRHEFAPFRRFARYPVLDRTTRTEDGRDCAWFADLRFVFPGLDPSFRFGACRDADGTWQMLRERGRFWID